MLADLYKWWKRCIKHFRGLFGTSSGVCRGSFELSKLVKMGGGVEACILFRLKSKKLSWGKKEAFKPTLSAESNTVAAGRAREKC